MDNEKNKGIQHRVSGQSRVWLNRRGVFPLMLGMSVGGAAVMSGEQVRAAGRSVKDRLSTEDRLEIMELFARYAWCYDCSDVEGYVDTFTGDGVIEAFGSEIARGYDSIRNLIHTLYREERGRKVWQHLNGHHIFDGSGDRCTVYSYWTLVESDPEKNETGIRDTGYYITDCVKRKDRWYISKRSIHRWDRSTTPW